MQDRSQTSRFFPRLLLITATLAAGTSIWFLLGEPESVIADEGGIAGALAVVAGETITEEEVMALAAEDLRALEQKRQEVIRGFVDVRVRERLVELAARSRGLGQDEFLVAELGKIPAKADDPAYLALIERLAAAYEVEYRVDEDPGPNNG